VVDPASEETLERIPRGSGAIADQAVEAARRAAPGWAALAPNERRNLMRVAADKLGAQRDALAQLFTREMGKPLRQAAAEINAAIDLVRSMSELVTHLRSGNQMVPAGELNFQHREPRGVAVCIVPWNFPIMVGIENVVPNLLVGNTVIWKPSEKTPLTSRALVEGVFDHLPPGVLNLVLGDGPGIGEPLVRHPGVDLVVFVGSERTGRRIAAICGETLKKAIIELGGKDPLIVDETVDVRAAARLAAEATYYNSGQICTSTERLYIARAVYEPFVEALVAESQALRIGDGLEPGVQLGPLVDDLQLARVAEHVDDALRRGAALRCGGERLARRGYFYPATVLTGVTHDMPLMVEETFGPVAPCVPFDDFDEAIALANQSRYGLAAIVCTTSAPRAIKAVHALRAGMIRINTMRGRSPGATSEPFGASGLGHGYGVEFLQELTRQKSVHWRSEPRPASAADMGPMAALAPRANGGAA
jgi:acyl-CoA reductase-like NAD-dependent aldehyde dehydrogenase